MTMKDERIRERDSDPDARITETRDEQKATEEMDGDELKSPAEINKQEISPQIKVQDPSSILLPKSPSINKDTPSDSITSTSKANSTSDQLQDQDQVQTQVQPIKTNSSEKNYSSFTLWEKRFIVFAATMGSFFSPFTAQIYFPALNNISKDLGVSSSKVNLTITTYMILQATAPAFIGAFSDTAGRRPAYIICFAVYIIADVALALQNNYAALLVLRMLQSAGSSGTVALASASVADVATSAERGLYIGITSLTGILAPSLGPILGGILSQYAGWKWIFWFLAILAGTFFIPMLLFMPETCRKVVDDGTVPPPKWNRSLMNHIDEQKRLKAGLGPPDYAKRDELAKIRGPIRFPNPFLTLAVAFEKECFCIIFFAGMVYAGFYAIITGLPSQLKDIYGFNDLKVGLMYLPISGGSLIAAFTQGKFIDWSFAREGRRVGLPITKSKQQDLINFPIEKARLQVALPFLFLASALTITYGWVLHFRTSLAGPIVLLFFLGYTLIASTQCISILIVECNPGSPGTATAAFNLIRCLLGAGATAVIVPMIGKLGLGWSYTLVGLSYLALSPLLFVVMKWGHQWRREKIERSDKKEKAKTEKREAKTSAKDKV